MAKKETSNRELLKQLKKHPAEGSEMLKSADMTFLRFQLKSENT